MPYLARALVFAASIATAQAQVPIVVPPPPLLPPATKLEGFAAPPGSVLTVGYDRLGGVQGVSVEVRTIHDAHGASASGLVIEVAEGPTHREQSFVDADEIADLIKGMDTVLAVNGNPTAFDNFEVRYATRGELEIAALSTRARGAVYAVQAGRLVKAQRVGLSSGEMLKLRGLFDAGAQKLRLADAAR